jgi:hypothetical protein
MLFFHLEQLHLVGGGKPLDQYSYWSKYVLWHCTAIGLYPYTPNRVKTICGFTKSMNDKLSCQLSCLFPMFFWCGTNYGYMYIYLILSMWLVSANLRSQDLEKHNFLLPMIQSMFLFLLLGSGMYWLCPQSFNRHSQVKHTQLVEPGALTSMYSVIACHVGGKLDSEALDLEEEIKSCKMGGCTGTCCWSIGVWMSPLGFVSVVQYYAGM